MRTECFLFVDHTTGILAKLSTCCFEHSGDMSYVLYDNPSHSDVSWEGRNACPWIYTLINKGAQILHCAFGAVEHLV